MCVFVKVGGGGGGAMIENNSRSKQDNVKIELPQNVQLFFAGLFVQSYVDWVLLHRKMLKTLYFKWVFIKYFQIFEKKLKIVFLVNFDLKFGKSIKNQGGRLLLDLLKPFFRKISKK